MATHARRPLVGAHRGASAAETENTIAAFSRAAEMGADLIEFDVRRTADGRLVVFHDGDVRGHAIAELTLAKVLERAAPEVAIPTLAETLAATRGRIGLDVELKEEGYEDDVVAEVREVFGLDGAAFSSFSVSTVAAIAARHPSARVGLILDNQLESEIDAWRDFMDRHGRAPTPDELVGVVRASGASFVAASHQLLATRGFEDAFASNAFPIFAWTVNDPDVMRRLFADPAIEGVLSDHPDVALAVREGVLGPSAVPSDPSAPFGL
jgi:glycerophosphoryl diester phosphodiesterase